MITEVTESELREEMQRDGVLWLSIYSPTCGPCRALAPTVERLAERYADRMTVVKLNASAFPAVHNRFGLYGVPTLILFKDGIEVARIVGARPESAIVEVIEPYLPAEGSIKTEHREPKLQRRAG